MNLPTKPEEARYITLKREKNITNGGDKREREKLNNKIRR